MLSIKSYPRSNGLRISGKVSQSPSYFNFVMLITVLAVLLHYNNNCDAFSHTASVQHRQQPINAAFRNLASNSKSGRLLISGSNSGKKAGLSDDEKDNSKSDFWTLQQELADSMSNKAEKSLRKEQMEKYEKRQLELVAESAFFSVLIFCILWGCFDNPFFPISYVFGSVFGVAYIYGLGKYVQTLGGSVDDTDSVQGAGVGSARFAFLILLFVLVGKLRSYGLIEIPAIMGFFTYQLAALSVGLREFKD